jgi:D-glycero-D-manno-heptose 1,7-bisphosphate phosphatase
MGKHYPNNLIPKTAVFLDRDGIITIPLKANGKGYAPRSMSEFKFYNESDFSIKRIKLLGYLAIIVSNQPDVANGLLEESVLKQMNKKILLELEIDEVNNCIHNQASECFCRKPKAGMIFNAASKWDIDLNKSWMVGDRDSDIESGHKAGCRTIYINRGWKGETGYKSDFICSSLPEAVDLISKFTI